MRRDAVEFEGEVTRARLGSARRLARNAALSLAAPFVLFLACALLRDGAWRYFYALAVAFAVTWGGVAPAFAIAAGWVARDAPLGRRRVVTDGAGISFSGTNALPILSGAIAGAMVLRGLWRTRLEVTTDAGDVYRIELPAEDV